MICAVHQPNFIPHLGFFHKYANCDLFVLYDVAQFSRTGFHHRNRIKTPEGTAWLTLPVHVRRGQAIRDIILADPRVLGDNLRTLECHYRRARWFGPVHEAVAPAFRDETCRTLAGLNCRLLDAIFGLLGHPTEVVLTSDLDLDLDPEAKATATLIAIAGRVGATAYLSGPGGRTYIETERFRDCGLDLLWQDFHPSAYSQLWGAFIPNLSILDALFNLGPEWVRDLIGLGGRARGHAASPPVSEAITGYAHPGLIRAPESLSPSADIVGIADGLGAWGITRSR